MIKGLNILLRPVQDEDWAVIEAWGQDRNALWGPYQRFQLDHVPQLRQAYQKTSLLTREGGFLLIETIPTQEIIGFVRYTLIPYPDAENIPAQKVLEKNGFQREGSLRQSMFRGGAWHDTLIYGQLRGDLPME